MAWSPKECRLVLLLNAAVVTLSAGILGWETAVCGPWNGLDRWSFGFSLFNLLWCGFLLVGEILDVTRRAEVYRTLCQPGKRNPDADRLSTAIFREDNT